MTGRPTPLTSKLRASGINTIIRYNDPLDETLPGKTLRRAERDLISTNGFRIAVVFRHNNDHLSSFNWLRRCQDAEHDLTNIAAHFRAVKAGLTHRGMESAFYGSGLVCQTLLANALADLCNRLDWRRKIRNRKAAPFISESMELVTRVTPRQSRGVWLLRGELSEEILSVTYAGSGAALPAG